MAPTKNKSKTVRKPVLNPEEIALNFKENKFANANGILELMIRLETGSGRFLLDCVSSLTEVSLQILKDGDLKDKQQLQKSDDLKNSLEKYQDWITLRFNNIVTKFIELLHHANSKVSERSLTCLLNIVQHWAWRTRVFPTALYRRILRQLLSPKVDCRKLMVNLKQPLQLADLAFITLECVYKHLRSHDPDKSSVHKSNLVALLLHMHMPDKLSAHINQDLWCSTRKSSKVIRKKAKNKLKNRLARRALACENDVSLDEDDFSVDESEDGEEGESGDDSQTEDKTTANDKDVLNEDENIDSDEEQRRKDDKDFKSAQKVKVQRKRKFQESDSIDYQGTNKTEPEDPNYISVAETKKVRLSKTPMLPPEAFANLINPPRPTDEAATPAMEEDGDSDLDDDEAFGGLPRELRGPLLTFSYTEACRYLSRIWDKVMSYSLTDDQYKRCLVFLPEHVMDHLIDPIKMTDFFLNSYNRGGAISLMAMHGVFLLMHKHNLQYPDFYPKVYRLLEPSVFNARYKPRFFVLLSMFLSSSHLPEYIAAAFVKRLSVLCLRAPSNCTILLVKCINNVLSRFPGLRSMYDDQSATELKADPYNVYEQDMKYCGAAESSLWELSTISHVANHKLYKAAFFIKKAVDPELADISPHLETTYDEMDQITAEDVQNIKRASANFDYKGKMFNDTTDNFSKIFC